MIQSFKRVHYLHKTFIYMGASNFKSLFEIIKLIKKSQLNSEYSFYKGDEESK